MKAILLALLLADCENSYQTENAQKDYICSDDQLSRVEHEAKICRASSPTYLCFEYAMIRNCDRREQ